MKYNENEEDREDDVSFSANEDYAGELSEGDLEASEAKEGAKVAKVKAELEACKKEKQEYLDGWQRAKADYANAQKRFTEERSQAEKVGGKKAAEAFLAPLDSLDRAEVAGEVPSGFSGIAKQLHTAAKDAGLARMGNEGDAFDPMCHEALGEDSTDEQDKDHTVSAVLEAGWTYRGDALRPARVRVYVYRAES